MTLFEKLVAAGIPVISADENGMVSTQALTEAQDAIYRDILLEHFQPAVYADLVDQRNNKNQIRTGYVNTIDTLSSIENAQTLTNAQILAAVKFMAKTLRLLLKLLRNTL
jgi:hypothetical protein